MPREQAAGKPTTRRHSLDVDDGRGLTRKLFRETVIGAICRNAKGRICGPFCFIGETGFEPATARPPANTDGWL
jgi:hypothetical protein